jgi:hypothetical protein
MPSEPRFVLYGAAYLVVVKFEVVPGIWLMLERQAVQPMVTKGLTGVRDSHDDVRVLEKWKPEPVECVRGKVL